VKLTVLSRSYCHLCDDLIAALEQFRGRFSSGFEVEVVDVDRHPAMEAQWGDKVPVLLEGDVEICHYFFDEAALKSRLRLAG
jgi:thioredoxin reductase (NADPH)